jgi:predicted nucleic acid-binding protein
MSAVERFFLDTNVLLYSLDPADPRKQAAARTWIDALWAEGNGRLSWQVLHEFYVNAVRKVRVRQSQAREIVEIFAAWQSLDTTVGLIQRAWYWMDNAQLSYWDALIVAAAERTSCAWLLTEDLQTGRAFGGVTILNPFERSPQEFGLRARRLEGPFL